jgi:large subunit ribosomal protein L4
MQVDLYNKDGKVSGQLELNDSIFAIEPNENAMHQAVVAHLANKRQGNAKTKIRSEVSGGGKKPWKQKGRGTARAGSTRSPLWVGGGTIHGPHPRDYVYKLPKKLNKLSRMSAYSLRISENNAKFIQDFKFDSPKTKEMNTILKNLDYKGESLLFITSDSNNNMYLSGRNIPKFDIRPYNQVSTYDLLSHKKVFIMESAIKGIEENLQYKSETV